MIENIAGERQYLIPVSNTNGGWIQTCEIPVIHTELKIGTSTITYLTFRANPKKLSGLDIPAGGENLEITGKRIIAQMISRLEIPEELQGPGSRVLLERIKEYFVYNNSNAQHGL